MSAQSIVEEEAPLATRNVDIMGGFAKGLSVVEAFSKDNGSLTIAEIARRAGLDRAATRRCLLTLVGRGYVSMQGRYFSLTPQILRLAQVYLNAPLSNILMPTLEALATLLHESCSASVLDGNKIKYIARSTQPHSISMPLSVGSRVPAYCTAAGRILLATLPPQEARRVLISSKRVALTERTMTDVDELLDELSNIRANGYALIDQELQMGSRAIAVPIFNVSRTVVAAMAVGAAASRATAARLRNEILPLMRESQLQLSQILA